MLNRQTVIPKIIHYCWFGGNEKPEVIKKCIASWKEKCPDYEIKEWNESNFDVSINRYTKEAYDSKKWAFVSDYARLWIVYHYGGIYLDTDVELLKGLDDLLQYEVFMFFQNEVLVNTGQGFGGVKHHWLIKQIMDDYNNKCFIKSDGQLNTTPCPVMNTQVIKNCIPELKPIEKDQVINNIAFLSRGTYNGIMYHYGTGLWTDKPNLSMKKRKWKDTKLKRFLRNPKRLQFVDSHFGSKLKKCYIFIAYDFLEYGPTYFLKKIIKKIKK